MAVHGQPAREAGGAPPGALQGNAQAADESGAAVARLALDVERAESLRLVKQVQVAYQQYAQFGMWNEMAALFADDADAIYGDVVVRGRAEIERHLLKTFGGGQMGLPPAGLHNQILLAPVVTLSYDGTSARGRWSEVTMLGRHGGEASWAGGMQENEYVRHDGRWKIARLHYYAQFAGPYETGWFPLTPTMPIVPYHYSPSQAGRPVPEPPGNLVAALPPSSVETLPGIERRIQALNDEDDVRNLQNIYGYYVDRKMWDDVTDLFTADGVLEIAGVGVYEGITGIRRALERHGPAGLQPGQVHDHLQLNTVVTIEPNSVEARARGMELGMLTPRLGEAYWTVSTFVNRYAKHDGTWRIREMRVFPKMKTDYYQGWGKSAIVDPPPPPASAPDRPTPEADAVADGAAVPTFFFPNPATGNPVSYPPRTRVVGAERLKPAMEPASASEATATSVNLSQRLAAARTKLAVSKGYDAVENISSSFGYYMDDQLWEEWTQNMSEFGRRLQGGNWYIGRDHLYTAMVQGHRTPPSLTNPRTAIRVHMRTQPVIHVAPDARSAKFRTRMWLYFASPTLPGSWNSGMYPNDAAVLEDGVWKVDVDIIDETYFSSPSYKQGWAKPTPRPRGSGPRGPGGPGGPGSGTQGLGHSATGNTVYNPIRLPGDIPGSLMDDFRRKDFGETNWPDIKPMWFHYRNPVSGRTPPNYCPDIKTCSP